MSLFLSCPLGLLLFMKLVIMKIGLNRLTRDLLKIDGAKHPKEFPEKIDSLLAEQKKSHDELFFKQLWSNQETDKNQG